MRTRINSRRLLGNLLVMFGCALLTITTWYEFAHWYNFGHLVSYGLHVDAQNEDAYIGIPGQTKMYWPELSNFSLVPIRLTACRPISDVLQPPLESPYAIQRFNQETGSWQTIVEATRFEFCLNPETGASRLENIYLLPGSSVRVMDSAAVGAMEPFRKNDLARWVVFRQVFPTANWDTAITSMPFRIEDNVKRDDGVQYRTMH